MSDTASAPVSQRTVFYAPGEGRSLRMGSMPLVFKVSADWTDGAYEMHEQPIAPRVLVAPHIHTHEDQVSYVTEGELGFLVGDEEFVAPAGSCIFRPRGVVHSLWNPTDAPARMLELSSPGAAIERYFGEFGEMSERGATESGAVQALGARYGITYRMDLVPGIEKKYGVRAAGGWWCQ
ncbi:cupin domain-containing protein [Streptomyces sp. NPDC002536]